MFINAFNSFIEVQFNTIHLEHTFKMNKIVVFRIFRVIHIQLSSNKHATIITIKSGPFTSPYPKNLVPRAVIPMSPTPSALGKH